MGSFARKRDRKIKKQASMGDRRARHEYIRARQAVKESMVNQLQRDHKCRRETIHNLMACFLLAMHTGYGFGRERLLRLRDKMQSEFDAIVGGQVSVEEIAEFLEQDLSFSIGIAESNPNAGHYRQIEFKAVQQMSAAFLMALLDEFDFKRKRLEAAYNHVMDLSDSVGKNETNYAEICAKVNAVIDKKRGRNNEQK